MKNLPKTNFELGEMFAQQGRFTDALFRFRVTEFLQADYPLLWVNVGSCYFRMGRSAEAKSALLKGLKQAQQGKFSKNPPDLDAIQKFVDELEE